METKDLYNRMFGKPPAIYWSRKTKIEYVQRRVLVHSILYYDMGEQVISNADYDKLSQMLLKMMGKAVKESKESVYAETFDGYDGSTGFDLLPRLHRSDKKEYLKLVEIAEMVLRRYNDKKGAKK